MSNLNLIILTGAPEADSLKWDATAHLLEKFEDSITRFAGIESSPAAESLARLSNSIDDAPYWRSIFLKRQHLPTGLSQHIWEEEYEGAQFFAASYIDSFMGKTLSTQRDQTSSIQSVEEVLSQFYEESYGAHQDVPSSQINAVSQSTTSFLTDQSSNDTSGSFESLPSTRQDQASIPAIANLTNLKDVPNANYLNSINPQTMTVNLVVGIISNPEPREIRTRRGEDIRLVEVIVGDETKSGFGINFWLSRTQQENALCSLRPRDVVLVRNVALSSFRGKVYGQSLRKEVTKIHLLYRKRVDKTDAGGFYRTVDLDFDGHKGIQIDKCKTVKQWVENFVGAAPSKRNQNTTEGFREILPPDTPPSQV